MGARTKGHQTRGLQTKGIKIAKWGNSLAIRLPQAFSAAVGGAGSTVRLAASAAAQDAANRPAGGFGEAEQSAVVRARDRAEAVIGKWGNSLAVRLPVEFADALGLKEGGMLVLSADAGEIAVKRQRTRAEALASFLSLSGLVTGSVRFPREDLLLRGPDVED